jgi:septal ring-binding cell division protein DamX
VIPASAHAAAVIPAAARVAAVIPAPRPVEQSRTTGWVAWAQIAAVRSQRDVAYEWRRLQARIAGLRGRALTVVPATAQGTTWWRLRVGSFATIDDAKAACALLRADGAGCLPIVSPPT